jgi:hypothetical protein
MLLLALLITTCIILFIRGAYRHAGEVHDSYRQAFADSDLRTAVLFNIINEGE